MENKRCECRLFGPGQMPDVPIGALYLLIIGLLQLKKTKAVVWTFCGLRG